VSCHGVDSSAAWARGECGVDNFPGLPCCIAARVEVILDQLVCAAQNSSAGCIADGGSDDAMVVVLLAANAVAGHGMCGHVTLDSRPTMASSRRVHQARSQMHVGGVSRCL
jgi:hypothetical protein